MLFASASSFAQFDQFSVYASGTGTYARTKNTQLSGDSKNTVQNAVGMFSLGIFPMSKLLTGINFSLVNTKEEAKNVSSTPSLTYLNYLSESSSRNIGPFVRYYITKGLFCEANYIFGHQENILEQTIISNQVLGGVTSSSQKIETKLRGFSVGAGYSFFVSKSRNLSIDAGVFYQSYKAASKYAALSAGLGVSGFIFKKDKND
jgi:hypothetical protein